MPFHNKSEHGGNIHQAAGVLQQEIGALLDFSANINPLGIPPALREIMIANLDGMIHYPDPEYCKLRRQLSEYTGVSSQNIIPGNGSSEIIFLLLKALRLKSILIPAPSFSEYENAANSAGINIRFFEFREDEGFRLNFPRLAEEIAAGVEGVILCNPNNPTATLVVKEEMKGIILQARRYHTMIIIDEAFIELTMAGIKDSVADLVEEYDNLFVIRAFTKAFAVPGLRLGYGVGGEDLILKLRSQQQPWPVNTLAACAGDFLTNSGEYLRQTTLWLGKEKEWLFENMKEIQGLKVFPPETNFLLVRLPEAGPDSGTVRERMAKRGILIRDASNFRFLNQRFIRVAVKEREGNRKLVQLLKEVLK
jgi:threonine-phosphate decarboxylase